MTAQEAKNRVLLPALLICGLALIANLNVLAAGFVWDDRALILGNPLIRNIKNLPVLFRQPFLGMYYRPVVMASFMADYSLWGLTPWGYHLSNLLLHCANALIVFLLFIRLVKNKNVALLAALLFAVHPVHKGIVAIADRTGLLSAFFFLIALLLYGAHRQTGPGRLSIPCYIGSLAACGLAFFAKEETLALPLIALAADRLLLNGGQRRFSSSIRAAAPFFGLAGFYTFIRAQVLNPATGLGSAFLIEPGRRLVTIPAVLLDYLGLLLFPLHLDYEPRLLLGWIGQPKILIAILILIICLVVILKFRKTIVGFGLLWYLVVFLPMSNLIPVYPEAARSHLFTPIHFLYLPSIGIFLCAAAGIDTLIRKSNAAQPGLLQRLVLPAFCGVLFLFSLLAIARNNTWHNELRLYRYIVRMHPENPRMRLNLGNTYLESGRIDEALEHLKAAVSLAPDVAMFRNSLALAYKEKGWLDRAGEELHQALRLDPVSAGAYINLTAVLRLQKQPLEAVCAGLKAIELAPLSAVAHANLGLAYMDAGALEPAERHLARAAELDPQCVEAYVGLGVLYAKQEQFGRARKLWEQALQLRPDMKQARENLRTLERMGY